MMNVEGQETGSVVDPSTVVPRSQPGMTATATAPLSVRSQPSLSHVPILPPIAHSGTVTVSDTGLNAIAAHQTYVAKEMEMDDGLPRLPPQQNDPTIIAPNAPDPMPTSETSAAASQTGSAEAPLDLTD